MFSDSDGDSSDPGGRLTRRALVIGALQAAGFGVLASRLYQVQVMEERRFAPLADTNRLNVQMLAPIRGRIFDRYGEVLADNDEDYRVVIVPALAGDTRRVLEGLAKVVPLAAEEIEAALRRAKSQSGNIPVIVRAELSFEDVARISTLAPQLPGVEVAHAGRRRYHHGHVFGHVVGYVGSVERFALDDDPVLRLPGMRVGQIGVERGMEARLRGGGGTVRREVDARGRIVRDLERTEPVAGRDVVLTIDTDVQSRVARRLSQEERAAAVVLHIGSGEVVAMASWPTHDTTTMVDGVDQSTWHRMVKRGDDPLFNRAIAGRYPPGSTFKMVTALAALEAGVIAPGDRIECKGTYELAEQKFRCWNRGGHGDCNLHRALKESCDVYFYEVAQRTGIEAIARMARRFGLGEAYDDLGIAYAKSGLVPDPEWKRGRTNRGWLGGETLLAGIGQGYVLSTPLELAVMTARLATGRAVRPTLIKGAGAGRGDAFGLIDVDRRWMRAVRAGMAAVVESGTGQRASLDAIGVAVAGKTGTSQVTRLSGFRAQSELKWELRDHALFVGYAPAEEPAYAVATVVEHGGSGGVVAAPLARDLLAIALELDPAARDGFSTSRVSGGVGRG